VQPPGQKVPCHQHNIKSQSLHLLYAYNVNVALTTSIWAKSGPLVEHQDHHVQEQEAHKDNLRHELTINVDTFLEVSGKKNKNDNNPDCDFWDKTLCCGDRGSDGLNKHISFTFLGMSSKKKFLSDISLTMTASRFLQNNKPLTQQHHTLQNWDS
jgi:hypothetical protein